jgi:hypothetical protein
VPNLENLKPWKPGQSGNPNGRPKKVVTDFILADLTANDSQAARALARVGLKKALEGDFRYFKEILDRVEGKVPDRLINEEDGAEEMTDAKAERLMEALDDDHPGDAAGGPGGPGAEAPDP